MDNNQNGNMQQSQSYGAQSAYGQPQQYQQQVYNQQYQQQYSQPQQYQQQQYQQQQYQQYNQQAYGAYGQQAYPKAQSRVAANVKNVSKEFTGKFSSMGLSVWCLLGIIGAILLVVAPFMNFASIRVKTNYTYEDYDYWSDRSQLYNYKIKASDGLNMFELSKLSGTINRVFKNNPEPTYINKNMAITALDAIDSMSLYNVLEELDLEDSNTNIKESTINSALGTAKLIVKGRAPLLITPWIIIICGIGLLIFTVINKKILKIVFAAVPLVCLIWLMACTSHFFAMMGIGGWIILLSIVLGLVSAFLDKPVYGM